MSRRGAWRQAAAGLAIAGIVLAVPFGWRWWGEWQAGAGAPSQPSYLPALERDRPRSPFDDHSIAYLQYMQPKFVVIGDSMAGRIDPDLLEAVGGGRAATLLQNATGSAYWYLAFHNYVLASGVGPRWVVVFFRDTNLTDVMFRLDGPYRARLDEVARDTEPVLNAIVERRLGGGRRVVHRWIDSLYRVERTREWLEPLIGAWPARVVAGADRADRLIDRVNAAFDLPRLRPMQQADMASAGDADADFDRFVEVSVLPRFVDEARESGVRLCLVRVARRAQPDGLPVETLALARYSADFRQYVEARGAVYFDDRDDPELAALPYADGDHVAREARVPYTRRFWQKLQAYDEP